jgi:hypothetical protein
MSKSGNNVTYSKMELTPNPFSGVLKRPSGGGEARFLGRDIGGSPVFGIGRFSLGPI